MSALQKKYQDQGLEILAFPCNQFGGQEPGSAPEVAKWAAEKFGATFQIFDKINVHGPEIHPVYTYFKAAFNAEPTWNFSDKFIIGKDGKPSNHFIKESWEDIEKVIVEELKK